MPRLQSFHLKLKTGAQGPGVLPTYTINGFKLEFDEYNGGTHAGEMLEASGHPQSFPHNLILQGPEENAWDIESLEITYDIDNAEPYTLHFGAVTLDDESDLNLWHERPAPVFDV